MRRIWDNSNIVESYGGVTTPLTFSFAREAYEGVYRQFCRVMRVPPSTIEANEDLFGTMLGLVKGRVYYNLLNWYRLLSLLPGFGANRRFMEQMMGVRKSVTVGTSAPGAVPPGHGVRQAMSVATMATTLAINLATLERRQSRFRRRLNEALTPPDPPLARQSADELAAYYRRLRGQLLGHWDAPIVNDFFAMMFFGTLGDLAGQWCGDRTGTLRNDLVAGEGGMISAEPARRIEVLAGLAAPREGFVRLLESGSLADIIAAADRIPQFQGEYDAYLSRFGERCTDELKLEAPTLLDDPLPLFRAVGQLARRRAAATASRPEVAATRARAEARVAKALARRPLRRTVFGWVLSHARARVRDRENLRFERTRVFGRVRRLFVEMGRRLADAGAIDDPRDIFYLQVDEVLAFVEGRAATANLRGLVALRRAEFDGYAAGQVPADRFETRGVVYTANPAIDGAAGAPEGASEQRGLGCSPGILRGPVRVVLDPASATIAPGTIVVAERTDPGWVVVFPSIAGLIVERGSLLSHSAIVARELGIPAIVSVPGATTWLRDGDWVEMDGGTGLVRKVAA